MVLDNPNILLFETNHWEDSYKRLVALNIQDRVPISDAYAFQKGSCHSYKVALEQRLYRGFFGTSRLWLVGQILDGKSNVCPTPVQSPSKDCPKTGHVEGLSSHRPSTVQALSNLCQVPKHLDRDWTGKS